jgi:hypothetical protein
MDDKNELHTCISPCGGSEDLGRAGETGEAAIGHFEGAGYKGLVHCLLCGT